MYVYVRINDGYQKYRYITEILYFILHSYVLISHKHTNSKFRSFRIVLYLFFLMIFYLIQKKGKKRGVHKEETLNKKILNFRYRTC